MMIIVTVYVAVFLLELDPMIKKTLIKSNVSDDNDDENYDKILRNESNDRSSYINDVVDC